MSSIQRRTPSGTPRCAITLAGALVIACAVSGCIDVLGLDEPRRESCPGCSDASAGSTSPGNGNGSATGATGTTPAPKDAAAADVTPAPPPVDPPDTGPPPVSASDAAPQPTFRCGTGADRFSYCTQTSEICCARDADGGGFDFACTPGSTFCNGVPITCARLADCPGSSVCCATNTSQICVPRGTCNGATVCDPSTNSSDCPLNRECRPFPNPNVPYFACQ